MDVRCYMCGAVLPPDEHAYAVVLKLKGDDNAFMFQHWSCWVERGRFHHYAIDYDYYEKLLDEYIRRSIKK